MVGIGLGIGIESGVLNPKLATIVKVRGGLKGLVGIHSRSYSGIRGPQPSMNNSGSVFECNRGCPLTFEWQTAS